MNSHRGTDRRRFLKGLSAVLAGGAASAMLPQLELMGRAIAAAPTAVAATIEQQKPAHRLAAAPCAATNRWASSALVLVACACLRCARCLYLREVEANADPTAIGELDPAAFQFLLDGVECLRVGLANTLFKVGDCLPGNAKGRCQEVVYKLNPDRLG